MKLIQLTLVLGLAAATLGQQAVDETSGGSSNRKLRANSAEVVATEEEEENAAFWRRYLYGHWGTASSSMSLATEAPSKSPGLPPQPTDAPTTPPTPLPTPPPTPLPTPAPTPPPNPSPTPLPTPPPTLPPVPVTLSPTQGRRPTLAAHIANSTDLTTYLTLLIQTDILSLLQLPGNYTVFAPTNPAFAAFNQSFPGLIAKLLMTEYEVHRESLAAYHITNAFLPAESITNGLSITTLVGGIQNKSIYATVSNNAVALNGPFFSDAQVVEANILASNGILHKINKVMTPPFLYTNLVQLASGVPQLSTLVSLVVQAGLSDTLSKGVFTLLAPTNDAFNKLPTGVLGTLQRDLDALRRVLLYHAIPNIWAARFLQNGLRLTTVNGAQVNVTITSAGAGSIYSFNNAAVIVPDAIANNGLAHIIDTVLIPPAVGTTPTPAPIVVDAPAGSATSPPVLSPVTLPAPTLGLPGGNESFVGCSLQGNIKCSRAVPSVNPPASGASECNTLNTPAFLKCAGSVPVQIRFAYTGLACDSSNTTGQGFVCQALNGGLGATPPSNVYVTATDSSGTNFSGPVVMGEPFAITSKQFAAFLNITIYAVSSSDPSLPSQPLQRLAIGTGCQNGDDLSLFTRYGALLLTGFESTSQGYNSFIESFRFAFEILNGGPYSATVRMANISSSPELFGVRTLLSPPGQPLPMGQGLRFVLTSQPVNMFDTKSKTLTNVLYAAGVGTLSGAGCSAITSANFSIV